MYRLVYTMSITEHKVSGYHLFLQQWKKDCDAEGQNFHILEAINGWTLTSDEDRESWRQKARDKKPIVIAQDESFDAEAFELTGRAWLCYCNEQVQGPHNAKFKGWKDFSEEEKNTYINKVKAQ